MTATFGPPTPWSLLSKEERWELAVEHGLVDPKTARDERRKPLEKVMSKLFDLEVFVRREWGPYVPFVAEEPPTVVEGAVEWARESTRRWRESL